MSYQKAELPKPVSLVDIKTIEGFYLGSEVIEIEGHEKKSLIHIFEAVKDIKQTRIWGFNLLDRLLQIMPKEILIKILYKGIEDKGDKTAHQCEVWYDDKIKRPEDRRLPFQ